MTKYEEYDARLLQAIANGADNLTTLSGNNDLKKLAEPHRRPDPWGGKTDYFRIVDRRLQALRKQGLVFYENRRWVVTARGA